MVIGTSHRHFDTLDSPRLKFGGNHHLPPYSILYSSPPRLHPNGYFSWDFLHAPLPLFSAGSRERPSSPNFLQLYIVGPSSGFNKGLRSMSHGIMRRLLRGVVLQHSSTAGRIRQWQLPSPSSFLCNVRKEEEKEGDGNIRVVAFFVELRCNAAPQQEEEGDGKQLPSPSSWSYAATQLHNKNKKATTIATQLHSRKKKATAVTFFCCAAA